jgi:hypothetical protein
MASHVHCSMVSPRGTQPRDELFPYISDKHPNIQSALFQSQPSQRLSHDGGRPSRTNLQDALSTTMSDLATITNAPASMVTRHGFSCIQPSATSLSLILVQEPALMPLPVNARHLYSSQAGFQRRSSWPAYVFRSSLKCSIINCNVFFFHRESHFWHQFATYSGFSIHDGTLLHSKSQYTTFKHSQKLLEHTYASDPHSIGTLTPIEFFQQDLLWQSSNTHSHSCSQKASKHTSGQSIVRSQIYTFAPDRSPDPTVLCQSKFEDS